FDPNQRWNKISGGVTFARHSNGDTLTLSNGKSWATDYGFAANQFIHISNTASNNTSGGTNLYQILSVSGSVMTLSVGNRVTAETAASPYIYYETVQTGPTTATDLSGKQILMSPSAQSYLTLDTSVGGAGTPSTVQVAQYTDTATVKYAQNNAN